MSAVRCQRKYCGALMDARTDGHGVVTFGCLLCERNRRGQCRDCGAILHTANRRNTMRCDRCGTARARELALAYERQRWAGRRVKVARWGRRYRARPEIREHRRHYMNAYRAANRDSFDRAYQRAYMAQRRADPVYRDKQNARKRELRALRKQVGL